MQLKKMAYLKIKVKNKKYAFCELYSFVKPTVLYLPHNLILTIKAIEKTKVCLIATSTVNPKLCKKVILSLYDCMPKKVIVDAECLKTILCLKLCAITILKPCCNYNNSFNNSNEFYSKDDNYFENNYI